MENMCEMFADRMRIRKELHMRCNTSFRELKRFRAEQHCVNTDPLREDSKDLMLIRGIKFPKVITNKLISGESNLLIISAIILCIPPKIFQVSDLTSTIQ